MGRSTTVEITDGPELASARRTELDIPRRRALEIGQETLAHLEAGGYRTPSGRWVDLRELQGRALAERRSVPADAVLAPITRGEASPLLVRIGNWTTTAAAFARVQAGQRPIALSFANGVTPGGGFLSGARAQEEALCRQSGLYPTLLGDPMYALHRARTDFESSDACILSPDVPFFRDDQGALLDNPWCLSLLTCAAPVATRVGQPRSADLTRARIRRVLGVSAAFGYSSLVLGAWGCGAFGNDPAITARDFRETLEGPFSGLFRDVTFAICDWSEERRFLGPFRDAFFG